MRARTLAVFCLSLVFLAGCGPHRLTPEEQAAHKRHEARAAQLASIRQAAVDERKKKAEAIDKAAKEQRDRHNKLAKGNREQFSRQPLPTGVHQVGSQFFIADHAHIANLRHICRGKYGQDHEGNDVVEASILPDGSLKVKCEGSVFRFRDEAWQTYYLHALRTDTPVPGVNAP